MKVDKLESARLILRNYQPQDWERVHIYGSQPEFSQFEIWGPNTVEDSKKFVNDMVGQAAEQNRYKFDFAICLKESGLLIGGAGVRRQTQESSVADMGWAINPEFQKRGFATEAARTLLQFGFSRFNLAVMFATCDVRNTPSYRVMEKLGMKRVGFMKGDKEVKGRVRDSYRYEILPSEFGG